MNFFGIGNMELIFILLIAALVLGPARMVDVARNLGKFWGEAQRTLRAAADAATVKLDEPSPAPQAPDAPAAAPAPQPEQPEGTVARGSVDGAPSEPSASRPPSGPASEQDA